MCLLSPSLFPPQGYWQPEGDINRYHVAIKVLNEEAGGPEASKEILQVGGMEEVGGEGGREGRKGLEGLSDPFKFPCRRGC